MAVHPANIFLQAIFGIIHLGLLIAVLVHTYRLKHAKIGVVRKQISVLLLVFTVASVITSADPFYIYGVFPNWVRDMMTLIRTFIITVVACLWVYSAITSGYALSMKPEPIRLKRVFFTWFFFVIFLALVGTIVKYTTKNTVVQKITGVLFAVNLLIWFFAAWYHFRRIVNFLAARAIESEKNSSPSMSARMVTTIEIRRKAYGMCFALLLLTVIVFVIGISNLKSEQTFNNISNDPSLLHPVHIVMMFFSVFLITSVLYNYWIPRSALIPIADRTDTQTGRASSPSSMHSKKSYTSNPETETVTVTSL